MSRWGPETNPNSDNHPTTVCLFHMDTAETSEWEEVSIRLPTLLKEERLWSYARVLLPGLGETGVVQRSRSGIPTEWTSASTGRISDQYKYRFVESGE